MTVAGNLSWCAGPVAAQLIESARNGLPHVPPLEEWREWCTGRMDSATEHRFWSRIADGLSRLRIPGVEEDRLRSGRTVIELDCVFRRVRKRWDATELDIEEEEKLLGYLAGTLCGCHHPNPGKLGEPIDDQSGVTPLQNDPHLRRRIDERLGQLKGILRTHWQILVSACGGDITLAVEVLFTHHKRDDLDLAFSDAGCCRNPNARSQHEIRLRRKLQEILADLWEGQMR